MSMVQITGTPAAKRCRKCGEVRPLAEFHKAKLGRLGVEARCRSCKRLQAVARGREALPNAPPKRCIKCGVQKPSSEYTRDRLRPDGLCPYCKDCTSKDPERRRLRLAERASGLRRCSTCGELKPPDDFHRSKLGLYGRDPRCKACRHKELPATVAKRIEREADRRRCKVCGEDKPFSAFYTAKSGSTLRSCRVCVRVRQAAYARAHPAIYIKASRKYQRANPEVVRMISKRRKARRKGAEGDYSRDEWEALKARYGRRCLMCGLCEPLIRLTPDHIVPLSKGGSNYISNIQPLCGPCNSSKRTKTVDLRPGAEVG